MEEQKETHQHQVSHAHFMLSVFKSRETFMALYLGLFQHPLLSLIELRETLHRTRSPPLAVQYTYELLQSKSCEAYGLIIIRFLSQLSDLSEKGGSMSISLKDELSQGIFLAQLRSSLAHKYMISDQLIMKARGLILKDLKEKYWKSIYQQMKTENLYSPDKVRQEYQRIFGLSCSQKFPEIQITVEDLKSMHNYEFHVRVGQFLNSNKLALDQFLDFFQMLTQFKKTVTLSKLLTYFSVDYDDEYLFNVIQQILSNKLLKQQSLKQRMVLDKLKRIRFNSWIDLNQQILNVTPSRILEMIQIPFKKAELDKFDVYSPSQ